MQTQKNYSFLDEDGIKFFLQEIGDSNLMNYTYPEKYIYESIVGGSGETESMIKIYSQATNDISLMQEINKENHKINWLKIEGYFEILKNLLDEDDPANIKPFFIFGDMDVRRYIIKNHGKDNEGRLAYKEYESRKNKKDIIGEKIKYFFKDQKTDDGAILYEELRDAIVEGRDLFWKYSEENALKILKEKDPMLFQDISELINVDFCCGKFIHMSSEASQNNYNLQQHEETTPSGKIKRK